MSRLAHGEVSVCQQGGRGEPASGPIELHYTRADVDEEDMPWLEIDQFPGAFDGELASYQRENSINLITLCRSN